MKRVKDKMITNKISESGMYLLRGDLIFLKENLCQKKVKRPGRVVRSLFKQGYKPFDGLFDILPG